jgi:hypothetical protein
MKRIFDLVVLFGVIVAFSAVPNQGFARGGLKPSRAYGHRTYVSHRVNQYGNGIPNPDSDSNGADSGIGTNYPAPVTFGTGTGHYGGHGGGNPNSVKPHPPKVLGLQPVSFPTGPAKTN